MNELVRLYALDGVWEVGGADRRRGIWPEDLTCAWDDVGPRTANFTLKRDPGMPQPDLSGLTPIEIEKGAGLWEGFIDQAPEGDEHSLSVEAIGWPDHGNDDLLDRFYVHDNLTDWVDCRSFLEADLTRWPAMGQVQAGDGAIVLGFPKGSAVVTNDSVGVCLDLGPSNVVKRVVIEYENAGLAAATYGLLVRGSESPTRVFAGDTFTTPINIADPTVTASPQVATFVAFKRFVTVFLNRSGANVTEAADRLLRITAIRVFSEITYESGNQSNVKASTVLKDALPRLCRQWSQDVSGIDDTLLNFPHLTPSEPRTFKEIVSAVNAPHGYVAKLERGRRFRFKPQPTVPAVAVGDWDGVDFRDTSKNSTRDIYNKAIGRGVDRYGRPLTVVRYSGLLPTAPIEVVSSPSIPNPSFATDVAGWVETGAGTFVRDAVVFHSAPASGKWAAGFVPGDIVDMAFTGTFLKDTVYYLNYFMRVDTANARWRHEWGDLSGSTDDFMFWDSLPNSLPANTFVSVFQVWVPKADRTSVTFRQRYISGAATALNIDSLSLWTAKPTLLDRRGRVRAQSVQMPSQAIGVDVLSAFADVFLQTHMRTRASGDLTVRGRSAVDFTSGDSLDPFELGEKTGELVCLLNEIDPDTGRLGRDVPIAGVTYSGNDESAQLALDDQRENFEKIVARYDLLAGR